jgi:hypothetical protein
MRMRDRAPIHAVITRHDTCTAERVTACGSVPVLALCRKLIAAGYDPALPLRVSGDTLALKVCSIGEGAHLWETYGGGTRSDRPRDFWPPGNARRKAFYDSLKR